jgi:hypothetical protein
MYYRSCKKEYLKEFYGYLKENIGTHAYFDHVFGNKPNKKNLASFFSIPLIQCLLQACFSEKDNLLQVLLNWGPAAGDDDDDFDQSQDGTFESTQSRSSAKRVAASPNKGRGKASPRKATTPVKATIRRVKKERKMPTAREIIWLHHEVCHTLNLGGCWPDELKEYGDANIKKVGRGKPKNPASLGIKKGRPGSSKR